MAATIKSTESPFLNRALTGDGKSKNSYDLKQNEQQDLARVTDLLVKYVDFLLYSKTAHWKKKVEFFT